MKTIRLLFAIILILSIALSISQPVLALSAYDISNPRLFYDSRVADKADILTRITEAKLNKKISQLEQTNGREIEIVTVPDIPPEVTPKQFATQLLETWDIGKEEQNNEVLLLISQRNLEVNASIGENLPLCDREIDEIVRQKMIPEFQKGNFNRGILAGTEALIYRLQPLPEIQHFDLTSYFQTNWGYCILILFFLSGFIGNRDDG